MGSKSNEKNTRTEATTVKLVGRRRIHQRRGAQPRNRVVVKTRYPRTDAVEGKIHRTMSHGEPGGSDCSCVSTVSRLYCLRYSTRHRASVRSGRFQCSLRGGFLSVSGSLHAPWVVVPICAPADARSELNRDGREKRSSFERGCSLANH